MMTLMLMAYNDNDNSNNNNKTAIWSRKNSRKKWTEDNKMSQGNKKTTMTQAANTDVKKWTNSLLWKVIKWIEWIETLAFVDVKRVSNIGIDIGRRKERVDDDSSNNNIIGASHYHFSFPANFPSF